MISPMKAAVYLRMSIDPTGEGLGVDRQREDLLALCRERHWTPVEYEDNDRSATKGVRPAYQRMLADIDKGGIKAIVAWHPDRLYRKLADLLPLIDLCNKHGVAIATHQAGLIDLATDAGRLSAKILGAVAENEGERKSARQKRANKQTAESGKGWGRRAFGYKGREDKPDWGDHLNPAVVPEEAEAIVQGFASVLAGGSIYGVAKAWNEAGLLTSQGSNPWDTTSVRRTLQNPRYAGLRTYQGEVVGTGDWPVIVDRDTWEAVNYLLDSRKSRDFSNDSARERARTHLLGGILRCGKCGKGLGVGRRQNGPRIYKCKTVGCNKVSRKSEPVDAWVSHVMVTVLKREPWLLPTDGCEEESVQDLQEQIAAIDLRMVATAEDFKGSTLPGSFLRNQLEDMQSRIDGLRERIARAIDVDVFEEFVSTKDVEAVWKALSIDRKRAVINKLSDGIVVGLLGKGSWSSPVGTGVRTRWREPYQSAYFGEQSGT
jgi:DNA invertase Pin-like site-specific DNA recombinase